MKTKKWKNLCVFALFVMVMVLPAVCGATQSSTYGSASNQPWNEGLNTVKDWITGPIPITVGAIAIAGYCVMAATGNSGHVATRVLQFIICISAAVKASTLVGFLDVSGTLFK